MCSPAGNERNVLWMCKIEHIQSTFSSLSPECDKLDRGLDRLGAKYRRRQDWQHRVQPLLRPHFFLVLEPPLLTALEVQGIERHVNSWASPPDDKQLTRLSFVDQLDEGGQKNCKSLMRFGRWISLCAACISFFLAMTLEDKIARGPCVRRSGEEEYGRLNSRDAALFFNSPLEQSRKSK